MKHDLDWTLPCIWYSTSVSFTFVGYEVVDYLLASTPVCFFAANMIAI